MTTVIRRRPDRYAPHPAQSPLVTARQLHRRGLNCSCVYVIQGRIDIAGLRRSYQQALESFDALRLVLGEDGLWQVAEEVRAEVVVSDQRSMPGSTASVPDQELQRLTDQSFDLAVGPLGLVSIIRLADDRVMVVEVFDHTVADGRSLRIMHRAVESLYAGEPATPDRPMSYLDQLAPLSSARRASALRYFSQMFSGHEPATDQVRSDESTGSDRWMVTIDSVDVAALRSAAAAERSTLAGLFFVAHSHAIARHLGSGDVATGVVADSRAADANDVFGQFAVLAPLRIQHVWSRDIRTHVAQTTRQLFQVRDHLCLDVEDLASVGVPVHLSKADATAFVFQDAAEAVIRFEDAVVSLVRLEQSEQAAGLTTVARLNQDGSVQLSVRAPEGSRFTGESRSIGECQRALLAQMRRSPATRLGSDALLPADSVDAVTAVATPLPAYPQHPIAEEIIQNLGQMGDKTVVEADGELVSAHQLIVRVAALERELGVAGLRPGDRVSVTGLAVTDRVVAFLAVLRTRGVYVPFGDDIESGQLAVLEDRVGATVRISADGARRLRTEGAKSCSTSGHRLLDGAAYIVMTSGTTGTPKAVVVGHSSLANLTRGESDRFGISARSRVLLVAPPTVDPWIAHVSGALLAGASLVPAAVLGSGSLADFMATNRVTHAFLPAAVLRTLDQRPLPSLEMIATAGDYCSSADIVRFEHTKVFNIYGPTEATVTATIARVNGSPEPVPAGRPIRGTAARIVIDRAASAPVGVIGELMLTGAGLALGYLDDQETTDASFRPNPFDPGTRWYSTGDRAYLSTSGDIVLCGRIDRQVKIRGTRVEPEAIEAAARRSRLCRDARVTVVTPPGAQNRTLALFVTDCLNVAALREELARQLPPAAVPHRIVGVGSLPRTAAGKIDDEALTTSLPALQDEDRALPLTRLEQAWFSALGTNPRPDDTFFASGGDSLNVLTFVREARAAGLTLTPSDVYAHPRFADLAPEVARASGETPGPAGITTAQASEASGDAPFAISPAWFFALNLPQPSRWIQTRVLNFNTLPSQPSLAAAIRRLIEVTPILRSAADPDLGVFRTAACPTVNVPLLDLPAPDSAVEALLAEMFERVDHRNGTMLAAAAARRPDGSGMIFLAAHHLAVDIWSWMVIESRVHAILAGDVPVSEDSGYSRYARTLAAQAHIGAYRLDEPAWKAAFADSATSAADLRSGSLHRLTRRLSPPDRAAGAIGSPVFLAVLGHAFARVWGPGATTIDLERNARSSVANLDLSDAVGWISNHHPVRLSHIDVSRNSIAAVSAQIDGPPDFGAGYGVLRWMTGKDLGDRVGRFAVDVVTSPDQEGADPLVGKVYELTAQHNAANALPYAASISLRRDSHGATLVVDFDPERLPAPECVALVEAVQDVWRSSFSFRPSAQAAPTWRTAPPTPAGLMQQMMLRQACRGEGIYLPRQLIRISEGARFADVVARYLADFMPFRTTFHVDGSRILQDMLPSSAALPFKHGGNDPSAATAWFTGPDTVSAKGVLDGAPAAALRAFADGEDLLLGIELHHAVLDGVGNATLLNYLRRLVHALRSGGKLPGPPAPVENLSTIRKHIAAEPVLQKAPDTLSSPVENLSWSAPLKVQTEAARLADWAVDIGVDDRAALAAILASAAGQSLHTRRAFIVSNGRDERLPGYAECLGMMWYFVAVDISGSAPSRLASRFYQAAARPLESVRTDAAQWPAWETDAIAINITRERSTNPPQGVRVEKSRDRFHFDHQVSATFLLDGSLRLSYQGAGPAASYREAIMAHLEFLR